MTDELQALLDACVDAVIIVNHRGIVETFNPAGERLFGVSAAEMVGRNVSELMPEPDRSRHDDYIRRYVESREPRVIGIGRHVEARRLDGSTFPAFLTLGRIGGTEPPRFVGFLHDMSERRTHELQILRQDALLREAQRIAQIGNFEVHLPSHAGDTGSEEFRRILRLADDEPVSLQALADWHVHTRETSEARLQSEQMGRSLIDWLATLGGSPVTTPRPCPWPIAFALAAARSEASSCDVLLAFGFSWAENQVQAALKSVPLGQSAGQRILAALARELPAVVDAALAIGDEARQAFTPGLAIASSRHETQYSRLFRS